MRLLILLGATLAGVLLFLLATASGNTSVFASHYPLLLGLNAALAGLLAILVAWQIRSLWRSYRQHAFGSRLTVRLLVLLATMAVVPGVLVYTVSVQFLSKSVESWFDVKVDAALEEASISASRRSIRCWGTCRTRPARSRRNSPTVQPASRLGSLAGCVTRPECRKQSSSTRVDGCLPVPAMT